jgi:pyrimidine-nucleoside phosphorylase
VTVRAVEIIEKKRDGQRLSADEIGRIVIGHTRGEVPDYQMAAFLMAVLLRGMDDEETVRLTESMVASGQRLDLSRFGRVVDKHSTGGIGDKVTLVVAPLVAACGAPVAKMSGRGLGITGGTLDKLESFRGYRVDLSTAEFLAQLERIGIVVTGQTADLAPADGAMYALRDVTGTVPSIPLIASSIMSKKIASGAHGLVLDVKVGRGAFMKTIARARELARLMVAIGKAQKMDVTAELTAMDAPLGSAVGNALEVKEAIATLRGEGPDDLREVVLSAGSEMLFYARRARTRAAARPMLERAIADGSGLRKLEELVAAQGGDARAVADPSRLARAKTVTTLRAGRSGYVARLDAEAIGLASVRLGAGREKKGDPIDHASGIVLRAKPGDRVAKGEPYAEVHASGRSGDGEATEMIRRAFTWRSTRAPRPRLVLGRIASG